MILARGIGKRFGPRLVLRGVDLQVQPGEIVALLGPNGAGKSTLLRILATLTKPSVGDLQVAGLRLPQDSVAARARIGFLAHQPLLYEDLSAEQNLAFYARLYGIKRPAARINDLLRMFDLHARRREPVRTFSRGMQQRLAIARAVLHRPRVLLLDEPHSGLDREGVVVLDKLLRIMARQGCAILLATHDLQRTQSLAKRVEVLAGGRLAASLSGRKLTAKLLPALYDRTLRSARNESRG